MAKGIYKLTNDRTGEVYVGQSNNMYRRYLQHMDDLANGTHHNRGMQSDYNRGDTFSFEILELIDGSREELYESEKYQIRKHDSFYAGYNQTPGGEYDKYKGQYQYGGGRKHKYKSISIEELKKREKKQQKPTNNEENSNISCIASILVFFICLGLVNDYWGFDYVPLAFFPVCLLVVPAVFVLVDEFVSKHNKKSMNKSKQNMINKKTKIIMGKICPNCGVVINERTSECKKCKTMLDYDNIKSVKLDYWCNNCYRDIPKSEYCPYCGSIRIQRK